MAWHSETWTWLDGEWVSGNPGIMGPRSHAAWQASSVFDGARVFNGWMPDMDRHAERVNASAAKMGLKATMPAGRIVELAREGAKKFGPGAELYVKPMYWGESDGPGMILPDPEGTRFCLCMFVAPMPVPGGASMTVSVFRRPTLETMPTDIKTGALYPNNARALREAKSRGFDNALVLDMLGNVAETTTSNIFMAKDGVVHTPAPNGTFLNGITRQRMIRLLREKGATVMESTLRIPDFETADEIFMSGNFSKCMPVLKFGDRELQPGPFYRKAREAYWEFAATQPV
ncbi:branched-chain amino acid aminotransferase [Terrarubrum flagellatum]|uniref:branched-chain amino acid aminotransferase n=1 Tax=Terrirubrum flagellatum TaxID=2895980 RepID=UPI0031452193